MATSTTLSLPSDIADSATQHLQPLLTELLALRLDVKQAHWNVQGRHFRNLHLALDELAQDLDGWIDAVAERIVAAGVPADGRPATVAAQATAPAFPEGFVSDETTVEAVATALAAVAADARRRLPSLEQDLVSQDLVIDVVHGLEKHLWMLRSQLA